MKFSYLFRSLCFQTTKQDKKNTLIYNAWSRILQTNRSIPKNAARYCNDSTIHVNWIEITGCVGQKQSLTGKIQQRARLRSSHTLFWNCEFCFPD